MTKIIAICGLPGAGKTTLANSLGHMTLHTDDYINSFSFKDIPGELIEIVEQYHGAVMVVEGVQVARMLRTGHREGIWKPDTVIWVVGGDEENKISHTVNKAFEDWESESDREYYRVRIEPPISG